MGFKVFLEMNALTLSMSAPLCVSIIIRTYCEERYIAECIQSIQAQKQSIPVEIVVVDSESTDKTTFLAKGLGAKVVEIKKIDFSFGRAINEGVLHSKGNIFVILSAHCIPIGDEWLSRLIDPILRQDADLVFGGQLADPYARCSEFNFFKKKYCINSNKNVDLTNHFNNANSAFTLKAFNLSQFDEKIGAQEDILFAKKSVAKNLKVCYAESAKVIHYHNFSNKNLFFRNFKDTYWNAGLGVYRFIDLPIKTTMIYCDLVSDFKLASDRGKILEASIGILCFRFIESISFMLGFVFGKIKIFTIKNDT